MNATHGQVVAVQNLQFLELGHAILGEDPLNRGVADARRRAQVYGSHVDAVRQYELEVRVGAVDDALQPLEVLERRHPELPMPRGGDGQELTIVEDETAQIRAELADVDEGTEIDLADVLEVQTDEIAADYLEHRLQPVVVKVAGEELQLPEIGERGEGGEVVEALVAQHRQARYVRAHVDEEVEILQLHVPALERPQMKVLVEVVDGAQYVLEGDAELVAPADILEARVIEEEARVARHRHRRAK